MKPKRSYHSFRPMLCRNYRKKELIYVSSVTTGYGIREKNRFLVAAPLNHVSGIRTTFLSLGNGGCAVYMEKDNNMIAGRLRKNVYAGVPYFSIRFYSF